MSSYNHYVLERLPIELSNFPYLPPLRVLSNTVTPARCASECVLGLLGAPYLRAVGSQLERLTGDPWEEAAEEVGHGHRESTRPVSLKACVSLRGVPRFLRSGTASAILGSMVQCGVWHSLSAQWGLVDGDGEVGR